MRTKQKLREEIEQLTRDYLSRGKSIDHLSTCSVVPRHMKWLAKEGRDYSPWHHGPDDLCRIRTDKKLDEGCTLTSPLFDEED